VPQYGRVSLISAYAQALRRETGHSATWLPTVALTVGSVVRVVDELLEPITSLGEVASLRPVVLQGSLVTDKIVLQDGVSLSVSSSASSSAEIQARVSGKLEKERAFLFAAKRARTDALGELDRVETAVLELYSQGKWKDDWLVVTSVMTTEAFTTAICRSSNASVVTAAEVSSSGAATAAVRAGAEVSVATGTAITYWSNSRSTPLYRAYGIKKSPLRRKPKFRRRWSNDGGSGLTPVFVEMTDEDLGLA
jgi:hypothetical protein